MAKATCAVDGCERPRQKREWCSPHYNRLLYSGEIPRIGPPRARDPRRRFMEKVDRNGPVLRPSLGRCWLWTGPLDPAGYGTGFHLEGRSRRANRASHILFIGPIPPGMFVDHKCHNPACVRPEHLQAVTPRKNAENRQGAQKRSRSGVRGVYQHPVTGKYKIQVFSGGVKYRPRGWFTNLAEAEAAVIALRNRVMTNNLLDRQAG